MKDIEIYGVGVMVGVPAGDTVDGAIGVDVIDGVIFDCNSLTSASSTPDGSRLLNPPPCERRA